MYYTSTYSRHSKKRKNKALSCLLSWMLYKTDGPFSGGQLVAPFLRNDWRNWLNSSSNVFSLLYQKIYKQSGKVFYQNSFFHVLTLRDKGGISNKLPSDF